MDDGGRPVDGTPGDAPAGRPRIDLVLDPPHAVGPIRLGMTLGEAQRAMRALPGYEGDEGSPFWAHYASGLSIAVETTREGEVTSVEVYAGEPSGMRVVLRGTGLLEEPAEDVVRVLAASEALEITEGGRQVVAPALLLALWRPTLPERPDDEDGRFFSSVLVARPGYYEQYR